jgi:hypothetical protein
MSDRDGLLLAQAATRRGRTGRLALAHEGAHGGGRHQAVLPHNNAAHLGPPPPGSVPPRPNASDESHAYAIRCGHAHNQLGCRAHQEAAVAANHQRTA